MGQPKRRGSVPKSNISHFHRISQEHVERDQDMLESHGKVLVGTKWAYSNNRRTAVLVQI